MRSVMTTVLARGAVLMIAVDALVGLRLLRVARRTRRLPEALLGSAFVLLGVLGYPLTTAARRGVFGSEAADAAAMGAGLLIQDVACLGVYVFTARTFRAGELWARALVWLVGAAFVASLAGHAVSDGFAPGSRSAGYWLGFAMRTLAFGWACVEALRQHQSATRRLRLGLVDPLVANRFLIYAIGMGGVFAAFAIHFLGLIFTPNAAESVWVLAGTGAVGVVTAIPTWLAFMPPAAYRRWIVARAEAKATVPAPAVAHPLAPR